MRSRRETVLLLVFLGALAIAGMGMGWAFFSRHLAQQKAVLLQKEAMLKEAQSWLGEEEAWKAKGGWLKANPAPPYRGPETDAGFVQDIQASLARADIEIVEQKIQETKPAGGMVEVQIDLVLSSPLEKLVRWLFETQKAGIFRVVSRIKLQSDADEAKIRTEISLIQLYEKP